MSEPQLDLHDLDVDAIDVRGAKPAWPYLVAGLVIGGAAMWGLTRYLDNAASSTETVNEVVALTTASVTVQTLTEEVEWTGTLGYGDAVSLNGTGGTITDAAEVGSILERGDMIASVDDTKLSVFYGSSPFYRTLSEASVGPDVRLLESNLVALGYDPDVTVTIDDEFTYNTGLMVQRWQGDLGNEETAVVEVGTVVVVAGPVTVSSISAVGQPAGINMATLEPQRSQTDVVTKAAGQISNLPAIGATISHGSTLYSVDGVDVVSIGFEEPVSTAMTRDEFTIEALERALRNNGYDPDQLITIDETVTEATTAAIRQWQSEIGLPVTGAADPVFYAPVRDGQLVESLNVIDDGYLAVGRPVLTTSASELSVVVNVSVSDEQEFEIGQAVNVALADGTEVDGVVATLGAVTQTGGDPTIDVVINIIAASDVTLVEGPVTVTTISSEITDALVVPTRALLSLREGGFAVEVERNGSAELVAIELGVFDDGFVQVTAGALSEGDQIVVPQ